jgi:hypothetical protein
MGLNKRWRTTKHFLQIDINILQCKYTWLAESFTPVAQTPSYQEKQGPSKEYSISQSFSPESPPLPCHSPCQQPTSSIRQFFTDRIS